MTNPERCRRCHRDLPHDEVTEFECNRRQAFEDDITAWLDRRYNGLPFPVKVPVCRHCGAADEIGPDHDCHACGLSQADRVDARDSTDA